MYLNPVLTLGYIFAALYIDVLGDFESFPSIITERECYEYITFSHNFMIHSMGKLGA